MPATNFIDRNLYVAAHEDDDLLFMSPDLFRDNRPGHCTRTIYLTAGDVGLGTEYWQSREAGIEAAYAQMAGVLNSWTTGDAGVPGHSIRVRTLVQYPAISVVFMRLPDGYGLGTGTAATGFESLQKLLEGSIDSITAVDGSESYTDSELHSTMSSLITNFAPNFIHMLNFTGAFGDGDHSDHVASAFVARDALSGYEQPYELFSHRAYGSEYLDANVDGSDLEFKRNVLTTYGAFDSQVCQNGCFPGGADLWTLWSARQYYADVQSSAGSITPGTSNVARMAGVIVAASSENASTGQLAVNVVDGSPLGTPIEQTQEWATVGEGPGSWLSLTFPQPVTIDRIVLYDRPNTIDQVTGATLTFSDGSSVDVDALDNGLGATTVSFTAKTVTSVRFDVTSVSAGTINVGLAEIEVYGAPAPAIDPLEP